MVPAAEGAAVFGRGVEHGLVAREVGLAGENVHALRAGDAGHPFHGESLEAGGGVGVDARAPIRTRGAGRVHGGDDERAGRGAGEGGGVGRLDREDDAGTGERRGAWGNGCAGVGVGLVGDAAAVAGAGLDGDLGTERDELLRGLRGGGDAAFVVGRLRDDGDLHVSSRSGR